MYALDDSSDAALASRASSSRATSWYTRAIVTGIHKRAYTPHVRTPFPPEETLVELDVVSGGPKAPASYIAPSLLGARSETKFSATALLRDEWTWAPVSVGNTVHLVGTWESDAVQDEFDEFDDDLLIAALDEVEGKCAAPDPPTPPPPAVMVFSTFAAPGTPWSDNLFVVNPDIIISSSRLASVASCMRRPMLQERIKSLDDTTYSATFGTMVHSVLQMCLLAETPASWDRLGNFTDSFMRSAVEDVLIRKRGALIIAGVSTTQAREELLQRESRSLAYVYANQPLSAAEDARGATLVQIVRVLDAEEDVVSPMYGLKGRVDASVQVEFSGHDFGAAVVPLEIKTGRVTRSMEHVAQTSLYTLILGDRFGVKVDSGLLLYTQSGEIRRVYPAQREIRSLILARNEMAAYKTRMPPMRPVQADIEDCAFLPPTIDNPFKCSRCYARDACMLYRRVHNPIEESPIDALYDERTAHLTDEDVEFYRVWDALLSREERTLVCYEHELWTLSASDRASTGRCICGLELVQISPSCVQLRPGRMGSFAVDDLVLLSVDQPVPRSLAHCRVERIDESMIQLRPERDARRALNLAQQLIGSTKFTFRLDTSELMQTLGVARYNLACMFYADAPRLVQHLKKNVVKLAPPRFRALTDAETAAVSELTLNDGQCRAVKHALSAQDYSLIHGMPGTGKTTTAAALIRVLAALGQRVLLCSYTHSAVDTILSKLVSAQVDVLRVGPLSRVHPRVKHMALEARIPTDADAETCAQMMGGAQVVAATSLATNDAIFAHQEFDVCLVDEASQVTLPHCIGPLRFAERFVMIGDHKQLAPVVRDPEAAVSGLGESVFERLCGQHPAAVTRLAEQYRMNDEIMALSNTLVYNGALTVPPVVAQRRLLSAPSASRGWLAAVGDPARPVLFVDTSGVLAHESRCDSQVENIAEGKLVSLAHAELVSRGIRTEDVGILTPYRQQVRHLRSLGLGSEVLTVDQAQGRDWPVVIASLVRSNNAQLDGELLRDLRRLNVLLTRAQSKLILVGAKDTVSQEGSPIHALLALIEKHVIPADSDERASKIPRYH